MTAQRTSSLPDGRYRVEINDSTFDVVLESGQLSVNGEPVECTLEPVGEGSYTLIVDGRSALAMVLPDPSEGLQVWIEGHNLLLRVKDEQALLLEKFGVAGASDTAHKEIRAPMPGLVLSLFVEPGQQIQTGAGLLVLEAMKMENELRAPADGIVRAVHVSPGQPVVKNQLLIEFDA
jgi:biotin carboxyl carrier protein